MTAWVLVIPTRRPALGLGDAEVEHLHAVRPVGALGEEEVRGLEVAVDDAESVGLGDGLAGLEHHVDRDALIDPAVLLQDVLEVHPVEVLHDEVRRARLQRADVVDLHRVLAAGCSTAARRLAHEARHHVGVHRHLRVEELDGDLLVEVKVHGRHHGAHAPDAEHALDAILADEDVARHRDAGRAGSGLGHARGVMVAGRGRAGKSGDHGPTRRIVGMPRIFRARAARPRRGSSCSTAPSRAPSPPGCWSPYP